MKIKTALILCAGYGKRLNPLTLKTPKPLLRFKNLTMLDHTINFIENLGIEKIKINTFYLEKQILNFVFRHSLKKKIEVISDGKKILGTGGGILNLMNFSEENDFLIFNPDTFWNLNYLDDVNQMCEMYFNKKMKNCLLLTSKEKSYDLRLSCDFGIQDNNLNVKDKTHIYTGCQILNRKLFDGYSKNFFSVSEIWNKKLNQRDLWGKESKVDFIHLTDLEIYNKILKDN